MDLGRKGIVRSPPHLYHLYHSPPHVLCGQFTTYEARNGACIQLGKFLQFFGSHQTFSHSGKMFRIQIRLLWRSWNSLYSPEFSGILESSQNLAGPIKIFVYLSEKRNLVCFYWGWEYFLNLVRFLQYSAKFFRVQPDFFCLQGDF